MRIDIVLVVEDEFLNFFNLSSALRNVVFPLTRQIYRKRNIDLEVRTKESKSQS